MSKGNAYNYLGAHGLYGKYLTPAQSVVESKPCSKDMPINGEIMTGVDVLWRALGLRMAQLSEYVFIRIRAVFRE